MRVPIVVLLLSLLVAAIPQTATGQTPQDPVYNVSESVSSPVLVKEVKPNYPRSARNARIQGSVTLECVIRPDGIAGDIRVVKPLDPRLDQEAIKALKQWRFKPGTKDGQPVSVLVTIEMTFGLRPSSEEKLEELEALPTGLTVQHNPNPVSARTGGRSGRRYTWLYGTTVTALGQETVTITEFGAFGWSRNQWVFGTFTGKPFTAANFAEWYGCSDARIAPEYHCSDSLNWSGADSLRASRTRWYYIGVTSGGRRVKGEAIIEELPMVDSPP